MAVDQPLLVIKEMSRAKATRMCKRGKLAGRHVLFVGRAAAEAFGWFSEPMGLTPGAWAKEQRPLHWRQIHAYGCPFVGLWVPHPTDEQD